MEEGREEEMGISISQVPIRGQANIHLPAPHTQHQSDPYAVLPVWL